jgi:hypothetical protein
MKLPNYPESVKKETIRIFLGSLFLCLLVVPFSIWLGNSLSLQKSFITKIILRDGKIFLIQTNLHYHEDGNYTKNKILVLNDLYKKEKEIDLIQDIKQTLIFEDKIAGIRTDNWNRFEELIIIDLQTLTSQLTDKTTLEKSLYPQGIEDITFSSISKLLKVMDRKGDISWLDPVTLQNQGHIENEYAFREQHSNKITKEVEVSESRIMCNYYEQFGMDYSKRKRKIYKTPPQQNQKIKVELQNDNQIRHTQEQKESYASEREFLDGKFLGASLEHHILLVISFEDTQHKSCFIHCLDTDLQILWEKSSKDLQIDTEQLKDVSFATDGTKVFLSLGNELRILEKSTGNQVGYFKL